VTVFSEGGNMKKAAVALVLILASLALVACGGSDDDSSSTTTTETTQESNAGGGEAAGKSAGSATAIAFEADPNGGLAYTSDKVTAKAGKDTIDFTNPQPLMHDVAIEDSSGETVAKTDTVAEGSDSATAELKPGTYTFFCTVPGHREAGMEGTLTVK
jgi:plastocyanin